MIRQALLTVMTLGMLIPASWGTKRVALTFDDGPSGRFTQRLLEGLDQRQVRATFFLCGYRMEDYGELATEIAEDGHEIGIHGYSHDPMGTMDARTLAREIDQTQALLERYTGKTWQLLRPPGGGCSELVKQAAAARNLELVLWTVDPRDWAVHDAQAITEHVLQCVGNGDIILLHDMSDSSVDAALMIVDALLAQDFEFVTVSELRGK